MDDLPAFVRRCLDSEQQRIKGSGDLGWLTFRQPDGTMDHTEAASLHGDAWIVGGRERDGYASAQIVSRESERLAEVEAKRKILASYALFATADDPVGGYASGLRDAVILLAQPYAGRDGWREEWRAA